MNAKIFFKYTNALSHLIQICISHSVESVGSEVGVVRQPAAKKSLSLGCESLLLLLLVLLLLLLLL